MDRDLVNQRWDALAADDHEFDRDVVSQRWDDFEQGTFVAKPIASLDAKYDRAKNADFDTLWLSS